MDCNVMWCLTFTHPWTSKRRENATKYCLPLVVFILDEAILQRAKPYFIMLLSVLNPLQILVTTERNLVDLMNTDTLLILFHQSLLPMYRYPLGFGIGNTISLETHSHPLINMLCRAVTQICQFIHSFIAFNKRYSGGNSCPIYTPFRNKRDNLLVWLFYSHLWGIFCQPLYIDIFYKPLVMMVILRY